ncbi:MAG: DoxX family protein, partial [Acidobacteriaceae bacterium]
GSELAVQRSDLIPRKHGEHMDIGLFLLRLAVGLTMAANGARMFGWFGGQGLAKTGQLFEALGFQPGRSYALAAALAEIGGGVLLASGLATPLSAAIIFAVMIVAAFSAHIKQGFFITSGGFEYTFVLSAAALTLAFTGPGSLSLDAILGRSWSGVLWGLGAMLTGILASIVPLAQRREESTNVK